MSLAEIAARFGDRVAAIVDGCTDSLMVPSDDPEAPDPGPTVVRGRGDGAPARPRTSTTYKVRRTRASCS